MIGGTVRHPHRSPDQHDATEQDEQASTWSRQSVTNQSAYGGFVAHGSLDLAFQIGPPAERFEQCRDAEYFLEPLLRPGDAENGVQTGAAVTEESHLGSRLVGW